MSTALQKTPLEKQASEVFILGILSLTIPVGPVAWYLGSTYKAKCQEQGVEPNQNAIIGMTIGMVMSVILGAFVALFMLFVAIWLVTFVTLLVLFVAAVVLTVLVGVAAGLYGVATGSISLF